MNYGEYQNKDTEMTDCVICLLGFQNEDDALVLPCDPKHYFHQKCGVDWLQMKTECPLCREDFSEQIIKHITNSNQRMVRILEDD